MFGPFLKSLSGVGAHTSPSSDDLVARYRSLREQTRKFADQALELLSKADIENAAKSLGMFHRGTIVFDSEHMTAVLMNYLMLEQRRNGLTAIERLRAETPFDDPGEAALVDRMCQARFRLLTVVELAGKGCLQTVDFLTAENGVLVDMNLSATAKPGWMLATHVFEFDDFWMTTGAALPFMLGAAELANRRMREVCRCDLKDWPTLNAQQRSAVVTHLIRSSLKAGVADHVGYEPISTSPELAAPRGRISRKQGLSAPRPLPAPVSKPNRQPHLNDPCPCGSGRKYRRCCGAKKEG